MFGTGDQTQYRLVPKACALRSHVCEGILEMDPTSNTLLVPMICGAEVAVIDIVHSFLKDTIEGAVPDPLDALDALDARTLYKVLVAADAIDIDELQELCGAKIARRWQSLSCTQIRTQWGFCDDFDEATRQRLESESALFLIEEDNCADCADNDCADDDGADEEAWTWPANVLDSVIAALNTGDLLKVQRVSMAVLEAVQRAAPRGNMFVKAIDELADATFGFAELHCRLLLRSRQEVELASELNKGQWGPVRHVKLFMPVQTCSNTVWEMGKKCMRFTALRTLDIEYSWTISGSESIAETLSGLHELEWLRIGRPYQIGADCAAAIGRLKKLRHLEIGSSWEDEGIGAAGMNALSGLTELTWLSIGIGNTIGDSGVVVIGNLTKLKYLSIGDGNRVGVAGLSALQNLTELKELRLGIIRINREESNLFGRLSKKLQVLQIGKCDIGSVGACAIAKLEQLRQLDIGKENWICLDGALALAKLEHLEAIWIRPCNSIGVSGVDAFVQARRQSEKPLAMTIWTTGNSCHSEILSEFVSINYIYQ